ncbi:glycosyltransferase family 4 protein [Acidomonas methanolica]|uniref:Glycosyl transferase n=1 Tax=Acidomonas methanolica NBRC 104435 TaxID=1231351 RepID=A0A023D3L2_ACIMT|nr:glycosyltransferase family 1 protein [Acidomonas methanolica]MBU2653933.1 glycosyltransferase family 1 protein [Acidomonas methanolica]TCS30894.1 glycosyltransferase involved in cell wall biosynthesis [Acidomonas methanolica]GAJ28697.1 glycosyl transferase [Acidomonas methanolica NBRC 104435]GBQ54638.1 glycosyltransferase [Acidomonas methanolica]GEK98309.1 glycosyl transferase [Acidomonas methanolica NBRC 104435]
MLPSSSRRILIATDAWLPQVNGVVRTMTTVIDGLRRRGHDVRLVHPGDFRSVPCPGYSEIRLAYDAAFRFARLADAFDPEIVHIVTEGPVGMAARRWARKRGYPFTTSYHTRFPEYLHTRTRLPLSLSYGVLRRFHNASVGTMAATQTLMDDLRGRGFRHVIPWTRGVDISRFSPGARRDLTAELGVEGPIWMNVGRVAVEKNLEAFLSLDLPGTKVVVGDGPHLPHLKARFPAAVFLGRLDDRDLGRTYAAADVFVFPSLTDTFGLVILEALASGVPVAAYDVMGPRDILAGVEGVVGATGRDLRAACLSAFGADRAACRAHAERFTWEACIDMFERALVPAKDSPSLPAERANRADAA